MKQLEQLAQKMGECQECMKQGDSQGAADSLSDMMKQMEQLQQDMEEGEMLESLFGSDIEFTFGLAKDAAYLAVGTEGVDKLKAAIDKSEELADEKVPPMRMVMAIGPLLELLADVDAGDDPLLSSLTLEVPEEDDRLYIVVKPVENGIQIHVEAEKGVLGALGTAVMTAAPQMGIPGL